MCNEFHNHSRTVQISFLMFDLRTLCLLAGLACFIAGAALAHARAVHRPSGPAVSLLGWAFACGGGAMLATACTGWVPARPGHWLSQLLGAAAFALLMESMRRLYARVSRMQVIVGSLGFLAVMLGLAAGLRVTASVGVGFEAVCLGVALLTVVTGIGAETPRTRRVLGGVLSAALVIECVRLWALWSPAVAGPAATAGANPLAADAGAVALSDALAAALFMLLPMLLLAVTSAIIWMRRLAQTFDHVWDDEVTGAATRKFLFAVGGPWLVANERQQSHTAVLMIDVDRLKMINAEYGHATGDRVLRHVASVLRRSLRSDSLITRFGDAEFCALVPVDGLPQAQTVSQRLCRVVEAARFHEDELSLSLTVTVSVGATLYQGGQSLEEVLRIVENRTAAAKAQGHNCVVAEDRTQSVTGATG